MNIKTFAALIKSGQLPGLLLFRRQFTFFYRLCFLASIADKAVLQQLYRGKVRVEDIPGGFAGDTGPGNATATWLDLAVSLGLLKKKNGKYSLRGRLVKRFAAPENDSFRALVREVMSLHYRYLMETPEKLEAGNLWDSAGPHKEFGDVIARSSRVLEPFLFELIDRFIPCSDSLRLLEVGCGNAGYIIYAAERHERLRAVGLELDSKVAKTARGAVAARGLQDRVTIEVADVREYRAGAPFDILTLYNNIYYFPVEERIGLLAHLKDLLNPGGCILLTTGCMGGGIEFDLVNLIHGTTRGWGRLPYKDEMLLQLGTAGFKRNRAKSLIPGNGYYGFIGYKPL
ncbi:MAG: class I SAM-dependent methyltransferase [Spirochaetes bacterium]|nr:class I SAM-dependent methyltransferase [Spirochaetota bacterium]